MLFQSCIWLCCQCGSLIRGNIPSTQRNCLWKPIRITNSMHKFHIHVNVERRKKNHRNGITTTCLTFIYHTDTQEHRSGTWTQFQTQTTLNAIHLVFVLELLQTAYNVIKESSTPSSASSLALSNMKRIVWLYKYVSFTNIILERIQIHSFCVGIVWHYGEKLAILPRYSLIYCKLNPFYWNVVIYLSKRNLAYEAIGVCCIARLRITQSSIYLSILVAMGLEKNIWRHGSWLIAIEENAKFVNILTEVNGW